METGLYKVGRIKAKKLNEDFDTHYEEFKKKAVEKGRHGELRFITEHGNVTVYVKVDID
jgi:hypothetical protein